MELTVIDANETAHVWNYKPRQFQNDVSLNVLLANW